MADETEKLNAEEKKLVEISRQYKENMSDSADLASKMVGVFKKLNVEMEKNQNVLKLSNSFNKQILSDTKARAMIEDRMASDIGKSQQKILALKMIGLRAQTRLEQEIIDLKKKQNDDVATAALSDKSYLIEKINEKAEAAIAKKEARLIKIKSISDAIVEKAEAELKVNQDLLKNKRSQAGFMAHMEDSNYAALGPFSDIVLKSKQFRENMKVIPLRFMLLNTLIKAGIDRFVALDKAAEDFRKQTGFSNTQMVELRKNVESINVEFQDTGVGINEVYASAKALTDVFGRTSLVSREAMQNVSLMSVNLGVAAEDSANVLATFQGLGGATQEVAMNVMKVGAGFSEKAGIPFSLVMKDIANASEQTTAMLGANPSKLMKSAIAARALGTDLNKIVSSQRKLLDFSSSINEELEASALLGRSISFQKARQLAYDGDIAGAAKATLAAVKAAGTFNEMNVYQREALAKASGMELKDLTKMMAVEAQRDAILTGNDQVARDKLLAQEETLKALERENDLSKKSLVDQNESAIRQQKMQGQMTKLKNIMESLVVSIGDILEPIITLLSDVVVPAFGFIAKFLKATFEPISWISKGIKSIATDTFSWSETLKNMKEQFVDFNTGILTVGKIAASGGLLYMLFAGKMGFGAVTKGISSSFGVLKGGLSKIPGLGGLGGGSGAVGKVGEAAKATKDVKSGTGVKDFLTNLASGLKDMGTGRVLFGAANLLLATPGLIAMIPVAIAASILGVVGPLVEKGLSSLAKGIESMGTLGVLKGVGVITLMGLSILGFSYAMKQFSGIKWEDVGLGILSLTVFTGAMIGLGALVSGPAGILLGIGLLALAGIMIGLSVSMKILSVASESLSKISFTNIGSGILEFGKALTSLTSIKKVSFGDLISKESIEGIGKLANMSDGLQKSVKAIADISAAAMAFTAINSFADSISKLADSLGRLNDQLRAIKSEELSKLSQTASATTASNTTTPTANTTLNTSGIEAKLDTLTNLLTGGAVRVYLDGKDVSSAMSGIGR